MAPPDSIVRPKFLLKLRIVSVLAFAAMYAATRERNLWDGKCDCRAIHAGRTGTPSAGGRRGPQFAGLVEQRHRAIEGQIYLNVTERFPFEDGTFQYIYAEQLIEHLPYDKAVIFLQESHRVLKSGGKLRLATPNLMQLLALFNAIKTPTQQKLLDYQIELYKLSRTPRPETVTLNLFFREWGHQFLYDPQSLRATLEAAGFSRVEQKELGISDEKDLSGIEMHWKAGGKELDEYTSMFFEATRP